MLQFMLLQLVAACALLSANALVAIRLEDLLHRPPARLTLLLAGRVVRLGPQSQANVIAIVAWLAAMAPMLRLLLCHNLLLLREGRCLLKRCARAFLRDAVLQKTGSLLLGLRRHALALQQGVALVGVRSAGNGGQRWAHAVLAEAVRDGLDVLEVLHAP